MFKRKADRLFVNALQSNDVPMNLQLFLWLVLMNMKWKEQYTPKWMVVVAFSKYSSSLSVLNLCFKPLPVRIFKKRASLDFHGRGRSMLEEAIKYLSGNRAVCFWMHSSNNVPINLILWMTWMRVISTKVNGNYDSTEAEPFSTTKSSLSRGILLLKAS